MEDHTWVRVNKSTAFAPSIPFEHAFNFEYFFPKMEPSIENFHIATGAFGLGFAMLLKDDVQPETHVPGFDLMRQRIHVFRASGQLVSRFVVPREDPVVNVSYICDGHICIIYSDSTVQIYSQFGVRVKYFKMAQDPRTQTLVHTSSITENAICVVFTDGSIVYSEQIQKLLYNQKQPKYKSVQFDRSQFELNVFEVQMIQLITESALGEAVLMTVSQNQQMESFLQFNLLKSNQNYKFPILQLDMDENVQISPTAAKFAKVKMNGHLGLFQSIDEPKLTIIDLQPFFETLAPPKIELSADVNVYGDFMFDFCQDFPVYYNPITSSLIVVKSSTKQIDMLMSTIVCIQQEIDGLSVYTSDDHGYYNFTFVQPEVKKIFETLGDSLGQKLYQAYKDYKDAQTDSSKITSSDQKLREVGANMPEGVQELITAADFAYTFDQAVELLQAASYVKLFCPPQTQFALTALFDTTKNELKTRHDVAKNNSGIYLSGYQFKKNGLHRVLSMLCAQQQFEQALKIHKFARLDNEVLREILVKQVICTALNPENEQVPDSELFQIILQQLQGHNCAGVFRTCAAFLTKEAAKYQLVTEMIEREPSLIDQVRLYLDMSQYQKALRKAFNAFNEELALESLRAFINEKKQDLRQSLKEIMQPENEFDNFPKYIKGLLVRQVLQCYKNEQTYGVGKSAFSDPDIVQQLSDAVNDQQIIYQFKLQQYLFDAAQNKNDHQQKVEQLNEIQTEKIFTEPFTHVFNVTKAKSVFNIPNFTLVNVIKQYGNQAVKSQLQTAPQNTATLLSAQSSSLIDEVKKVINMLQKKTDIPETMLWLQLQAGVAEGIQEYSQSISTNHQQWAVVTGLSFMDDLYSKSIGKIATKTAGDLIQVIAIKLKEQVKGAQFMVQLTNSADKRSIMKAAAFCSDKDLMQKGVEGGIATSDRDIVINCNKSMDKDVWEAVVVALKK
ncbi:Conserved_hypothetical protein [Hexamita inflata]|uniref:Vps16 N-terminal domain-containing protein n=1 Tax=Hexamita inflata TaxID=28002 RepID=A0AA86TPM2_9EUKA|nr:Conserved hypothetical protein [Hexamita inflata]